MSHNTEQRNCSQVHGFSAHIRSSNDLEVRGVRSKDIIWNKFTT